MNNWPFEPNFDAMIGWLRGVTWVVTLDVDSEALRHLLTAQVRVTPEMELPVPLVPLLVVTATQDGKPFAVALNPCLDEYEIREDMVVLADKQTPKDGGAK